jgi:tetratricopeptide (TPR) repeat protein
MRRKTISFLLVAALCIGFGAPAYSAEELFDTKTAALHTEKGVEYLGTKKFDAAIKEFEESAATAPDADAYYYLGYAYYMKGKTGGDGESRKKARENFDKAYELNPNFTPSKLKLGEPARPEPKRPAPAEPQPAAEPEERATGVYQGTEQPGQKTEQTTPPAEPTAPPEPAKEQQPQTPEPPKEQEPPQQPEPPTRY